MDYLLSAAGADPFMVWILRGMFAVLAVYILWTLFAQRSSMAAALAVPAAAFVRLAKNIWRHWGPMFQSRAIVGGLVMYATWRADTSMPPEVQNFWTEILMAFFATIGLIMVWVGRTFAGGPLMVRGALGGGLLSPGATLELDAAAREREAIARIAAQPPARRVALAAAAEGPGASEFTPDQFREFMDRQPGDHVLGIQAVRKPAPPKPKRPRKRK